jgi:hypothetical protein
MPAKRDNIMAAIDQLEQVVNECTVAGIGDSGGLARALAQVEDTVRRHAVTLAPADGDLVDVESPRLPSPVMSRRTDNLREELHDLLHEARALRDGVQKNAVPSEMAQHPETPAGALAAAPEAGAAPDFALFCRRARELVEHLERYENQEAAVILDAVDTDIGAGD